MRWIVIFGDVALLLMILVKDLLACTDELLEKSPQLFVVVLMHLNTLRVIDTSNQVPEDEVGELD